MRAIRKSIFREPPYHLVLDHRETPVSVGRRPFRTALIYDAVESTTRQPLLANIQALRAIAALLVVLIHMSLANVGIDDVVAGQRPWLAAFREIGTFGVDLFFVISGFIMLVSNWDAFGKRGASLKFLARRAIRIYPPYWFALVPVLIVFEVARARFMVSHVTEPTGIVESFLLIPNPHRFVLTVAWTLVWEMLFYVVFAAILCFGRRFVPGLLVAWLASEVVLNRAFEHASNFYLDFVHNALPVEFIFGTFVGIIYIRRRLPAPWMLWPIAVLATGFVFFLRIASGSEAFSIDRVVVFGIPAALIVLAAVASEASGGFVAPALLRTLGDGSYAVYLWHISVLVILRNVFERLHLAGSLAHAATIVISIAVVLAVGQLVYRYFECPVTRYFNERLNRMLRRDAPPRHGATSALSPSADRLGT